MKMNKAKICLSMILLLVIVHASADSSIQVSGELKALKTDGYTPPRIKGIWQYTISFMAEDGSVVKKGSPVLMFKTDAIQTKLVNAKGKLAIKKSTIKNNKVSKKENFENKSIFIKEKKMEMDKAARKADLPNSLLAKNDYMENQLNHKLAIKDHKAAILDLKLARQKSKTEEQIIDAEIVKLEADIVEYNSSISSMNMIAQSDGIVIHKTGWDNNKFAVGDTVWGGRRVIEVANLSKIIAKLEVTENKIKYIKKGQAVKVKLDALPDKEFVGRVESVAKVVRIKSKNQPSKILEVVVYMDNVDSEVMRPGMRLSATIETSSQP
jgi:multidrug resistance efflux pump